jgi:hypothetical protein
VDFLWLFLWINKKNEEAFMNGCKLRQKMKRGQKWRGKGEGRELASFTG